MNRTELYPAIEPTHHGMLPLDARHTLYWEQSGNANGIPVLFLHGGPGAGSASTHRRYFDPGRYRIVLFDQRGAGRSVPLADTHDNTTQHLVQDIERLRVALGVERWAIFGGSWGSALALAYGKTHPDRCLGFILRGVFLCRRAEVDWFLYGMGRFFPEAWRRFAEFVPAAERRDLLTAYHRRLIDPNPDIHLPAARRWSAYEGACSTLLPSPDTVTAFEQDRLALGLARIEAHYFKHDMFLRDNELIEGAARLRHLPCTIVQGRYDMVCPPNSADELARVWGTANLQIVADAGHSAMEPGIRAALVRATDAFAHAFAPRRSMAAS
ncbi:MAG: prolyl aminopeptidase [Rhodospirillaceae bacterium]|nr:prolyl aminopeptidase [Rhodospirillaceae bacterium]